MPKKNIQADKKWTAKPVGYRFRGKSKAKPTNAEIKKVKRVAMFITKTDQTVQM